MYTWCQMTLEEFYNKYPNDDVCLRVLFEARFGHLTHCPKCGVQVDKWYRLKKRKAFCGARCRHQIYPCAGTIFQKSRTPLTTYFYIIYLFATTKTGVSAMEISRITGIKYPTCWNIAKRIRSTMQLDSSSADDSVYLERQFNKSIYATHNWISDKYFQFYLAEFVYRYHYRKTVIPNRLFKKVMTYEIRP